MRQHYIPRNNPTLNKRTVRSLATVAIERAAAIEEGAIKRHASTKTAKQEREVLTRKMIRAIEQPKEIVHAPRMSRVERKAKGRWWVNA